MSPGQGKNPKCLSCHHLARWPHLGHQQPKKNIHITRSEPSSEGTAVIEADEFLDGILGKFLFKNEPIAQFDLQKERDQLGSSIHMT